MYYFDININFKSDVFIFLIIIIWILVVHVANNKFIFKLPVFYNWKKVRNKLVARFVTSFQRTFTYWKGRERLPYLSTWFMLQNCSGVRVARSLCLFCTCNFVEFVFFVVCVYFSYLVVILLNIFQGLHYCSNRGSLFTFSLEQTDSSTNKMSLKK